MSIINFIKGELTGWSKVETILVPLVLVFVLATSIYMQDTVIATIVALFGITCTFLAGKGKISCYMLGIISSLGNAYIFFAEDLPGNFLLQLCYYFPMQIIGLIAWSKHMQQDKQEIIKTQLSNKERLLFIIILPILSIALGFVFMHFDGNRPFLDAFTTLFAITGVYLTMRRCIDQWGAWFVVNALETIMWLILVIEGAKNVGTFLMWLVYLLLGIYFFFVWKEEMFGKKEEAA